MHSSKSSEICCYRSREDSQISTTTSGPSVKPWGLSPPELPVLNRSSMPLLPRWRCFQQWNRTSATLQKMSALSLHAYARLRQTQLPALAAPDRQDLGIYLDKVMAPQPLSPSGPMARGLLTTTGTHDVDLIPSPAQRMIMHEVAVLLRFPCEQYHAGVSTNTLFFQRATPHTHQQIHIHRHKHTHTNRATPHTHNTHIPHTPHTHHTYHTHHTPHHVKREPGEKKRDRHEETERDRHVKRERERST